MLPRLLCMSNRSFNGNNRVDLQALHQRFVSMPIHRYTRRDDTENKNEIEIIQIGRGIKQEDYANWRIIR